MIGRIKALRESFGFLASENGPDFYFRNADLIDDFGLKVGDRVTFDAVDPAPAKGPQACQVALLEAQQ